MSQPNFSHLTEGHPNSSSYVGSICSHSRERYIHVEGNSLQPF